MDGKTDDIRGQTEDSKAEGRRGQTRVENSRLEEGWQTAGQLD